MLKHEWQWTPHGTLATMIHVAWQFQSYARQHQSMLHSSWCRSKSSFNRLYGLTRMGFWSSWEVLECHIQAYHPRPVSSWAWPSQTCQSYTRSRPLWTAPRKENLPMEDGIPVAPIPPDSSCCLEHENYMERICKGMLHMASSKRKKEELCNWNETGRAQNSHHRQTQPALTVTILECTKEVK